MWSYELLIIHETQSGMRKLYLIFIFGLIMNSLSPLREREPLKHEKQKKKKPKQANQLESFSFFVKGLKLFHCP